MRLFVAAEVPEDVRDAVARIERPDGDDVRWTDRSTWHVTLRFLGELDDDVAARAALAAVEFPGPATAVLGQRVERVGPVALALPVTGLEDLAAVVASAFSGLPGDEPRRFRGHLTIGRLRRQGRWPTKGVGYLAEPAAWPVEELVLFRSHLGSGPARHEVVGRRSMVLN